MPRRDDKASPKLHKDSVFLTGLENQLHDEWRKWKYEGIEPEDIELGEELYEQEG